jgi:Fe-S oxidoreductase
MFQLKFDEGLCKACETYDCLTKCQYINLNLEQAKEERWKIIRGEDSRVLTECATCYACEEYCPNGNHPFYQIVDLQEAKGIHPAPVPVEKLQLQMMAPRGEVDYGKMSDPAINLCAFSPFEAVSIHGKLFTDVSIMGGNDLFCNLMYLHFAKSSVIRERLPLVIENIWNYRLNNNKISEMVCFHDECFGTYTSFAPAYGIEVPFKPVHFYEFIRDKLKEHKGEITPFAMKAAYQRPCSNRLCPETDSLVDEICEMIGVERVEREYDRENALCCAGVIRMQGHDDLANELQKKNLDDMQAAGAAICIFNCQFCLMTLLESVMKRGMIPVLLGDLGRMALGESLPDPNKLAEDFDLFSM